ncbi:hypothetical protein FZZ93_05650 [Halomonas eurihalina]|uniref:Uncharacterized protein n=1 Tax=Halomonas eurihalina TaxID=42566 RepID=A0A5D9DCN7_HALER|nr:hypothetical protein [Halomonas eurihalina]MDR5859432.1 hypothetical protein [Halomonas eurihalina]TZG40531.1 hypothetical protein FZZ93_05650 [Halomonas eurihalina]
MVELQEDGSIRLEIRYEGGDASSHQIDMTALGESLQGFGRIYAVIGHFAATGQYAKQMQALTVKTYAQEAEPKCFSVGALLSFATTSGWFQGLLPAIVTAVTAYVLHRCSGNSEEMRHLRELLEQQYGKDQKMMERMMDTIDRLADGLRPSVRKSVAPVGATCERIDLYADGTKHQSIDQAVKDAVMSNEEQELIGERTYSITISEMDYERHTCKVRLTGEEQGEQLDDDGLPSRINAVITDPAIDMDGNQYLQAFTSRKQLDVKAKATIRDGEITKLYISDTA